MTYWLGLSASHTTQQNCQQEAVLHRPRPVRLVSFGNPSQFTLPGFPGPHFMILLMNSI